MRSYDEYHDILSLWEIHRNKKKISRLTGIPRATVRDCINKFGSVAGLEANGLKNMEINGESSIVHHLKKSDDPENLHAPYAYIFGMYLGDGSISQMKRVHRLRIALDKKYPNIIQTCVTKLASLFLDNQVGIINSIGCIYVSLYHKHLPQIFPQDGAGKKHDRDIILENWQETIVDQYPLEFLRGLYHSDGSRSQNIVNGRNYPRYTFSNVSDDIRKLFTDTAEKLGLHWTTANARNVAISRQDDVAWLDERIGAKS